MNLNDHLWTSNLNPSNTIFLGGLVNWFQTGLRIDYTGVATPQGVVLTSLTVKPAPAPIVVSTTLPVGTVDTAYTGSISVSGGLEPYIVTVDNLPASLSFDGVNVSGIPAVSGDTLVLIDVTDALGSTASASALISINAPPANFSVRDEGQGKIYAFGADFIVVGSKKLIWNANTRITVNTATGQRHAMDGSVKIGLKVQWKGLRDPKTNTVLTSRLEIN